MSAKPKEVSSAAAPESNRESNSDESSGEQTAVNVEHGLSSKLITFAKQVVRYARGLLPQQKYASRAYRYLGRKLVADLASVESTPQIVFSSTGDLELNSEILLMLAYFLQDEFDCNVLLIDGTFRKGGVSDYLGIDSRTGFTDYICGAYAHPKPLVTGTANQNIFVMPAGSTVFPGPQHLEPNALRSRLKAAESGFEYVFIQQDCILEDSRYLRFNEIADIVLLHVAERETRITELEACQKVYEDHMIGGVKLILSE